MRATLSDALMTTPHPNTSVPTITLYNGVEIPTIGLGVFQTPPDETRAAVTAALDTGYRHIDTAAAYANEREVGEAVSASAVGRDKIILETKIWIRSRSHSGSWHSSRRCAVEEGGQVIGHDVADADGTHSAVCV